MGIQRDCPEATFYNYIKAGNRPDPAGKPFRLQYFMHFSRNGAARPTIAYVEISDGKSKFMCGMEPTCPPTTALPPATTTNYTGPPTNATTTVTTTVTTTTEAPPVPLSGADCAAFLKNVQQGFNDQQGYIQFLVPQQSDEWQLQVGF